MVQRKPSLTLAARTGCSATPWMDDRGRPRSFACSQAGRSQETIPRSPRRARVQPPHASHAAASSLIPSCEIPPLPPAGRAVGKAAMRRRHTAAFVRIYAQNLETCMCGPVSTLKVRSVTRCVDGWPPTEEMAEPETDPSFYARSLPQTPMISFGIGSTYALPRAVAGARTSIYSNVIDFLPLRFRLVAAGGTVQSFCPTDGHLGNVG